MAIKFVSFSLFLACLACGSDEVLKKGHVLPNMGHSLAKDSDTLTSGKDTTFSYFAKLSKNEELIDKNLFFKFVNVSLNLDMPTTKIIGRGFLNKTSFKLMLFKVGDKDNDWFVVVSFSKYNIQVDESTFLSYCKTCKSTTEVADIYLVSSKRDAFHVNYYMQLMDRSMPSLNHLKYSKREQWIVNSEGKFQKK